jgi:hypothetical protein
VGLANAYGKTNSKLVSSSGEQLDEDPELFLYTLLTSNNRAKAVDEFESFLRRANAITNYTDGIIFQSSEDGGFIAYDLIENEIETEVSDGQRIRYVPDDREENFYASVRVLRAGEQRDKPPEEREVYTGDQYFRFYSSREVQENLQNNGSTSLRPGEVAIYPGDIIQVEQGTVTALEPLEGAAILERARRIEEAFNLVDRAAIGKGLELWDAIVENKWITGALLGTFAGLQFTPVGPILDAALLLVGGFAAGFSFTSFLVEAGTAERQADLYEAAGHFVDFLAALADVATSSALLRFTSSENAVSLIDDFVNVFRSLKNLSENLWSTQVNLTNGSKISQALSLVFDRFIDADSALGRLQQFADTQVVDYLRSPINEGIVFNENPNNFNLDWLARLSDRWERVNVVADELLKQENASFVNALEQFPEAIKPVFQFDPMSAANASLIEELIQANIAISPEKVVRVSRAPNGVVTRVNPDDTVQTVDKIFLELGQHIGSNEGAGYAHILAEHADEFADQGIPIDQLADVVMDTLTNGRRVGVQGNRGDRIIYEYIFNGETKYMSITVGSNGFVVGANPVSSNFNQ